MTQPQGNIDMAEREVIQEAFTRVVLGLRKQGWKRSQNANGCIWRSEDGCRCALGHLMNDKVPVGVMRLSVMQYLESPFREYMRPSDPAAYFIQLVMPTAHDQSGEPSEMEQRFRCIAADRNLKWPEEMGPAKETSKGGKRVWVSR